VASEKLKRSPAADVVFPLKEFIFRSIGDAHVRVESPYLDIFATYPVTRLQSVMDSSLNHPRPEYYEVRHFHWRCILGADCTGIPVQWQVVSHFAHYRPVRVVRSKNPQPATELLQLPRDLRSLQAWRLPSPEGRLKVCRERQCYAFMPRSSYYLHPDRQSLA